MSNESASRSDGFNFDDGDGSKIAAIKHGTGVILSVSFEEPGFSTESSIEFTPEKAYEFAQWLLKQCAVSEQQRWIPCSERLPKFAEKVLVVFIGASKTVVRQGERQPPSGWQVENYGAWAEHMVSHWMQLPAPPSERNSHEG